MGRLEDLSWPAALAALEIDRYLRGSGLNLDFEKVKQVSEIMDSYSKKYLDPVETCSLSKLVWPNEENHKGKKVEDLKLHLHLFSKDLNYFTEKTREYQKELRDACIELSEISSRNRPSLQRYLFAA